MALSIVDLPWLPVPPPDWPARCKQLDAAKDSTSASLRQLAMYGLDARQSLTFSRALERHRSSGASLAPLSGFRLGILASNTVDLLIDCLAAACVRHGVAAEIVKAPYDQVFQQALDPASGINTGQLDAVLIAVDHRWLALDMLDLSLSPRDRVAGAIERLRSVVHGLREHGGATAILQTVPAPPHSVFGNYDRRMEGSLTALIGECNRSIITLAAETGSYLLDTATMAERIGIDRWFDPVQWVSYKLPFSAACGPIYAEQIGRLLGAIRGKARKCLVLDLDNTIWGGVVGDDGVEGIKIGQGSPKGEAFLSVQQAALELRDRGIFLAVSSKNDDAVARRPFREHIEMLLKEQHISVFQANWLDKPSNLESIARSLNIGLDSLVLLDDNPAERAQVRAALPMVAVPELPEDPSWYAWTLRAAGYFEAVTFSAEDRFRAEAVVSDARRAEVMAKSRDLGDYLLSLDMVIAFAPFDSAGRQRITQLINKTNQFNLTTKRYTEPDVAAMAAAPSTFTLQVRLKDKFGDLGMIGVVICQPAGLGSDAWEIDTWLMSCRVLGREVERAMLQRVVKEAKQRGIRRLTGVYIPTPKNGMVEDHYKRLGFNAIASESGERTLWELRLEDVVEVRLPMTVEGEIAAASPPQRAVDSPVKVTTASVVTVAAAIDVADASQSGDDPRQKKRLARTGKKSHTATAAAQDPVERQANPPPVPQATATVGRHNLESLLAGLRESDVPATPGAAAELTGIPGGTAQSPVKSLGKAIRLCQRSGKTDLLLDMLFSPGFFATANLILLEKIGMLAMDANRFGDFKAWAQKAADGGSPVRFPYSQFLNKMNSRRDSELRNVLFDVKYAGIADARRPERLIPNALAFSSRIAVDEKLLDHLFDNRRSALLSRADWEKWVLAAFGIESLIRDLPITADQQCELIDTEATREATRQIDQTRGALLLVCHAGFSRVRINFGNREFGNIAYMSNNSRSGSTHISIQDNARAALFAGLKALAQNRIVLIAPDGKQGTQGTTISVMGRPTTIGDGAAFLAYESKCPAMWYSMQCNGERFVPVIVPGPSRMKSEKFPEFRDRLVSFYETMLNDFFSGDPQNLVMGARWSNTFSGPSHSQGVERGASGDPV